MILPKKAMSEEDIKLNFITPALINSGWKDKITMETSVQFTDGKICLSGNFVHRDKKAQNLPIMFSIGKTTFQLLS
ncbi:MAG: hypothetical protein LIO74_11850 [Ruminococcus sp.]|nr:hypothetical protein [Ruminococcus sp.]